MKAAIFFLNCVIGCFVFAQDKKTVQIEAVSDLSRPEISKAYRFMVADFLKAGGEGRTFLVRVEDREADGYYFAVDKLPPSTTLKGISLFTRDLKVLESLKKAKKEGFPLFLKSIEHKIDAQVFGDDELGRPLRRAAFPNSNANFSLVVSPTATDDILIHEAARIKQAPESHPISTFLTKYKASLSDSQYETIRRALKELGAYQEQYTALEKMKKQGRKNMLTLVKDSSGEHHVEIVDFKDVYKNRMEEMQANSDMYMGMISSMLRKMPSATQCAVSDLTRESIEGMGKIESDLVERYPIQKCSNNSAPQKPAQGVR
ncbi:MAG: hypothetical protein JNL11_09750 [Bdellovibrionaceae bacterium]|nr:hypothetical protein [Pseudobdellovibrionaceae bacterium]